MVYNNRVVLRMRYVVREQAIERFFFLKFARCLHQEEI